MNPPKTKSQIAQDLGISLRTLQRWIKKSNLDVPRGLVCPTKQKEIKDALGFTSQQELD
ncbi:MAG: helix-turn-helix domain-containing protein [Bacteroidota bacterium]